MNMQNTVAERLTQPQNQTALRNIKLLIGSYLGLSLLTLAAIILLRSNASIVTVAVWVRGTIVVISALLTALFTAQMARGSKSGYLRLRIVSAVMFVAIIVIIALPGTFPLWMKIEQSVCGLLLLGVVVIVNGKRLRSTFARK